MDGWIDRWMDGWIDRWMDGWTDRWVKGLRPSFVVLKKWASLKLNLFPSPAAEDASTEKSVFYCLSAMCFICLLSYISSFLLNSSSHKGY
jgi:hypothetical protein